ncbi:hypothetical protein JRG19_09960 [Pseudoclavibacter alba]|uniref:hypothetical protein n=1 Tax=Pseudoclavibacter albus TaxID=272241 RepID=UPI0019D188EE|nr:hypothetical protein [Pseudoclavibacter alba]MBN6778853.1 hypothetical protein [Pseudoclavibacter alba]
MLTTLDSITSLEQRWQRELATTPHDFGVLGHQTCADLQHTIRTTNRSKRDQITYELVRQVQAGDTLAGELLLHTLLPKLKSLIAKIRSAAGCSSTDAADTILATAWEEIHALGTHITTSILGQIGQNTARRCMRTWGPSQRTLPHPEPSELLAESDIPHNAAEQLAEVFRWASETGTLTHTELRILATTELGLTEDREALAAELGMSPDSLRRRSNRIRQSLRSAIERHITTHGRW